MQSPLERRSRCSSTTAVTADPAAGIAVTVDGLSWKLAAAAAADKTLTLTLALAVDAGQKVKVTIGSGLHGETGTEVSPLSFEPRNESPAPPQPTPGSFFPSIAKPEFADNHAAPDPWVGEWGPKTDPYWLPSTGHLRALVVPVDFPDAQATRPAVFYRDLFTSTTPPWYAESSYGRLSFDMTAVDHWTRMANPVECVRASQLLSVGLDSLVLPGADRQARPPGRLLPGGCRLRRRPGGRRPAHVDPALAPLAG